MRKKIQKYLAGEREGFSLVELIIVIAIMAILIGVVTLAVLPNIAKSKESKDITALDSLLSAVNSAVASQQVSTDGSFDLTIAGGEATFPTAGSSKVADEVKKLMGKEKIVLSSSKATGTDAKSIKCSWTFGTGASSTIAIKVAIVDGSGATIEGEYMGKFETTN